jgi:hypothetical protein
MVEGKLQRYTFDHGWTRAIQIRTALFNCQGSINCGRPAKAGTPGIASVRMASRQPTAQPVFLTQNLHQPAALISPSISVHEFGSWNREQLLHC